MSNQQTEPDLLEFPYEYVCTRCQSAALLVREMPIRGQHARKEQFADLEGNPVTGDGGAVVCGSCGRHPGYFSVDQVRRRDGHAV